MEEEDIDYIVSQINILEDAINYGTITQNGIIDDIDTIRDLVSDLKQYIK